MLGLLSEEPRPGASRKLSGKVEALPGDGLLGSTRGARPVDPGIVGGLTGPAHRARETVRRRLAENYLKPWRKDMWYIPQVDGEYVARMDDVLDLYAEAPDRQPRCRGLRRLRA